MNLFDVLDAWDLLKEDSPVDRLNMNDWRKIGDALVRVYDGPPKPVLGSVSIGLNQAVRVAEGQEPLATLVPYALSFQCVWLPDPLYSFITETGARIWGRMPDSGSDFFSGRRGIHLARKVLWTAAPADRLRLAREILPTILDQLRRIRPLAESGAIQFVPWEPVVDRYSAMIRDDVRSLQNRETITRLSRQHRQEKYNLGIYTGAIGVVAGDDQPEDSQLSPGEPMWLEDNGEIITYGLVNAVFAAETGAVLAPELDGDRAVYEFVMSEGTIQPPRKPLAEKIRLPRFSEALLPELVAARKDSEALAILRDTMQRAAGYPEELALAEIENRLHESAEKIRAESGLWKRVGNDALEMALSVVGGAGTGVLTGTVASAMAGLPGGLLATAVLAGAGGTAGLGWKVVREVFNKNRQLGRSRADLLVRVADRLTDGSE